MRSPPLDDIQLLERLIEFDSVSHNSNEAIADFICNYLDRPGVTITRNPSPTEPKLNLLIEAGQNKGDRSGLILSGHMDVVPASEDGWVTDPFVATRRDQNIYGRGTADMKGFLAASMNAFLNALPDLRAPLALIYTYDEELGTLGARNFVDTCDRCSSLPARAIIGEPTELRVVRMHKGHLKFLVRFEGIGAHSGYPHLGRNAIEPAGRAIVALTSFREELESEHPEYGRYFPEVPFVALNVARVRGGTALNIVPDECVIEVGVRVLPGMSGPAIFDRARAALTEALGEGDYRIELISDSPPMLLDEGSNFLSDLTQLVDSERPSSASFATDAGWFQTAGIECALYGPGSISVAHKPNEFVPVDDLDKIREQLPLMISRWCQ